jgi:hypothetical protein
MAAIALQRCTVPGCGQTGLPYLRDEVLCVDHFLEQAFAQSEVALQVCHQSLPLGEELLAELLSASQTAAGLLLDEDAAHQVEQRESILEFLLCVANIYEYAAHHPPPNSNPVH